MNVKTMTMWAVGLLVGIIMVSGLIIPITGMYTDDTTTHTNKGAAFSLYAQGDTHTIIMDANGIKTDDGEYQPYPDMSRYGEATLMFGSGSESDSYRGNVVRISEDMVVREYLYLSGTYQSRSIGKVTEVPITVTITETGYATLSPATGTPRYVTNVVMYPDTNGNYALTYNPKITEGDIIYGAGNTPINSVIYGLRFGGTADNLQFRVISPVGGEVDSYKVNLNESASGLYEVSNVNVTMSDGTDLTYSYIFAPKEVTYSNPLQVANEYISLIAILPLFAIIALVLFGAYTIRSSRV